MGMSAAPLMVTVYCSVLTTQGRSGWLAEIQPHLVKDLSLSTADQSVRLIPVSRSRKMVVFGSYSTKPSSPEEIEIGPRGLG